MVEKKDVRILEVTIRDGSYEVGFQFTREDVSTLSALLDVAGFRYIEVGHGNGLAYPGRIQTMTDEVHLATARASIKHGKVAAPFPMSHIGPESNIKNCIDMIHGAGLDFVRILLDPEFDYDVLTRAIGRAAGCGLMVGVNMMKTYCLTPAEIARIAARTKDMGANWFFIVDSAGCMMPDEVTQYVEAR